VTPSTPLALALHPLLAARTPGSMGAIVHGFGLRLREGPLLRRSDPLLEAYGVRVATVVIDPLGEEGQGEDFDPGRTVRLVPEVDSDGDPELEVWSAQGFRRGGPMIGSAALVSLAALEAGLEQRAVVLTEDRDQPDDRRSALDVVVLHPGFADLDVSAAPGFSRPALPVRRRLVLVTDGAEVRWWDPATEGGPIRAEELPMSGELRHGLSRLRAGLRELSRARAGASDPILRLGVDLARDDVQDEAVALWRRARAELGSRYAIGFQGLGMRRPVWSPAELDELDDEDYEDGVRLPDDLDDLDLED
jgi:hypothetical protein